MPLVISFLHPSPVLCKTTTDPRSVTVTQFTLPGIVYKWDRAVCALSLASFDL